MSDCQTCQRNHLCIYPYKPCDCAQYRKFTEAPDVVQCRECCGEGYVPYPIACRTCNTTGWVRSSAVMGANAK